MKRIDARTIVTVWRSCRECGVNVFAPGVMARLRALPGWSSLSVPDDDGVVATILESIRALELLERQSSPGRGDVDLVVSHPAPGWRLPSTRDVARTLIQGAHHELVVLGYAITDLEVREHLVRRGMQGIKVTVVSDRCQQGARELLREWPAGATPLTALEGVEPEHGKDWKVHGKVLVADRMDALVGSANFTGSGLGRNLEIGIRLSGRRAAEICELVERLCKTGWLVRARP